MDSTGMIFGVREDLVVVGTDPEMADMSNPRGELIGEAHYIVAELANGRRLAHEATATTRNGYALNDMTVERLERLAAFLNAAQPTLDADRWSEIQAAYGSEAYVQGGWEAETLAWEQAQG